MTRNIKKNKGKKYRSWDTKTRAVSNFAKFLFGEGGGRKKKTFRIIFSI